MPPIHHTLTLVALGVALGVGATLAAWPEPERPEAERRADDILRDMVKRRAQARAKRSSLEPGTLPRARVQGRLMELTVTLNRYVQAPADRRRLGLGVDDGTD